MIVCQCKGVTSSMIKAEGHACGAGTICGGCLPLVKVLVKQCPILLNRSKSSSPTESSEDPLTPKKKQRNGETKTSPKAGKR